MFEIDREQLGEAEALGETPVIDDTEMADLDGSVPERTEIPAEEVFGSDEPASVEDAAVAPEGERPAKAPAKPKDDRNWFVVHTYSGYENKVKANLERRIHSMGMADKIFRVLVPMEDEVEFKDGKRKITPKKVFPGYVLVEMIMDDQSWYVVRNTQGVTGFVGSPGPGEKPVPLQDKEVKTIRKPGTDGHRSAQAQDRLPRRAIASRSPRARCSSTSPASSTRFSRVQNACARLSRSSAAKRSVELESSSQVEKV